MIFTRPEGGRAGVDHRRWRARPPAWARGAPEVPNSPVAFDHGESRSTIWLPRHQARSGRGWAAAYRTRSSSTPSTGRHGRRGSMTTRLRQRTSEYRIRSGGSAIFADDPLLTGAWCAHPYVRSFHTTVRGRRCLRGSAWSVIGLLGGCSNVGELTRTFRDAAGFRAPARRPPSLSVDSIGGVCGTWTYVDAVGRGRAGVVVAGQKVRVRIPSGAQS